MSAFLMRIREAQMKNRNKGEARSFGYFIPIREARPGGVDDAARTARVVVITEGLGNL